MVYSIACPSIRVIERLQTLGKFIERLISPGMETWCFGIRTAFYQTFFELQLATLYKIIIDLFHQRKKLRTNGESGSGMDLCGRKLIHRLRKI